MSESADVRPDARSNSRTETRPSDPTYLTTQALLREIGSLRELLEARLDAMDRATALFETNLGRVPTDTDKQIRHLKELHESQFGERFQAIQLQFDSIQTQFKERDTRTDESAKSTKVAVDAALQAAEKAVGAQNAANNTAIAKSETATTKQIDQLGTLIQTTVGGLNDKIDDLKSRLTTIEGKSTGYSASWGYAVGALGVVATIVGLLAYVAKN